MPLQGDTAADPGLRCAGGSGGKRAASVVRRNGCKAQKKSVIGAHNCCWKYLVGAITTHGEAKRDLEFIGGDKDRHLKKLWTETRISSILPWDDIEDEAERLLEIDGVTGHTSEDTHADQDLGDGQGVELDETDPSHEVIFGRRRPDSIAVDWNNKVLHIRGGLVSGRGGL